MTATLLYPIAAARPAPLPARRSADRPDPLNEAELSRIWAGQSFPPHALSLADGRRLRVVQPGRPGGSSGPDFRDAIVEIDGEERRGNVELHVRASSFRSHGHNSDPAYRGLALHVVYLADDGNDTLLEDGSRVPVAAFQPWLARRESELHTWLAASPLWREPCRDAANRLGRAAVGEVLRLAGEQRFSARVARLQAAAAESGEDEALWRSLLESLGAGGDRAAWRRLAIALPPATLRTLAAQDAGNVEAALLAVAGLAPAQPPLTGRLPRPLSPALSGGSRPLNRPERRLRALAALWQRAAGDPVAYALESVRRAEDVKHLLDRWLVASPDGGPALLGAERARELLLNAVLPIAAINAPLTETAWKLLRQLPAASTYGKTAFLEENLRSEAGKRPVRGALEQQGLLAMHATWCSQGGCGRCPLS